MTRLHGPLGHPAPSRKIVSTCFAARSIARSTSPRFASSYTRATRSASSPAPRLRSLPSSDSMIACTALSTLSSRRPMFASFRTIVTRIASSPAPVAIIFPIWVSTIDELNDPRPISTTAISDVPTIAAAIAAIFFGSIVFGSACAIRIPSRRAIVAPITAGSLRNSVRIPWRRRAASPSILAHPDDHLGEHQQGISHALVLRRDRRDDGHIVRQVHAVRDFLRGNCTREVALVREDHVRNPWADEVEHLAGPREFVRMACVDDEEDPAYLPREDFEDELEALLARGAENLGLDSGDVDVAVVERDRRAHPVDADRLLCEGLDDGRLPRVERAGDQDPREVHRQPDEVLERVRDPVRPDSVRLHLRDAHRVADDPAPEGRLELHDEVGQ